jgi:hypothetical protein
MGATWRNGFLVAVRNWALTGANALVAGEGRAGGLALCNEKQFVLYREVLDAGVCFERVA